MAVLMAHSVTVVVLFAALGASVAESAPRAVYVCGGDTLLVDPVGNWDAVVLHLDDGAFLLQQTMAASGVRYSDGERTFWSKGEEAFLEVGGVVVKDGCRLVRRAVEDPRAAADAFDLPVFSCFPVDVSAFNERVRAASGAGEAWTQDAARVALEYVGGLEARIVGFLKVDNAVEGATGSTVTVVREGFLDDSLRGMWDELHLVRAGDGAWEIAQAYRAYRCWRGPHGKSYSAELCP